MITIKQLVRPNILDLEPYSSARDEFTGNAGIFLDANENPFGQNNRYPDPQQKELKQKLAELKGVNTENIMIGNGSDEIIDLAFRIFCEPGVDKAITFTPTYGMYKVSAAINAIKMLELALSPEFQIDLKQLENYFNDSSIKLMFICSPNNPTGNRINPKDIEQILNKFNGIVIVDEAYIDFANSNSLLALIYKYNNLIVSQTFSKAWGLAAARVGVAYSCKEIIQLYQKVKPPYNVSSLNQKAALIALKNEANYKEKLKQIIDEKKRVYNELEQMTQVKKVYPSEANFILFQVENAPQIYHDLVKQNIIIRNRSNQIENCLRVTIGTPKENNTFIKALKKHCEKSFIYR